MLKNKYEKLPEYYPTMHLDGFTPEEILNALHKKMIEQHIEDDDSTEIIITTKEK